MTVSSHTSFTIPATLGPFRPLRRFLPAKGYGVVAAEFEGDPADVRRHHESNMARADLIMLFYGTGSPEWRKAMEKEIDRLPSLGRAAMPKICTLLSKPDTDDKQDMIGGPEIFEAFDAIPEADLTRLLVR